jgi:hypothetical protein
LRGVRRSVDLLMSDPSACLEVGMGSWLEELERRERAAMDRIEVLCQRIAELTDLVAAEEDPLSRLGITREMMLPVLSGIDPAAGSLLVASVSLDAVPSRR